MAVWTTLTDLELSAGKPGKQYIFRALRDNIDAAISGDPSAPKIQSGAFDDGVITQVKMVDSAAGTVPVIYNLSTANTATTSYVKVKEVLVERQGGYRIDFDMAATGGGTAYGRIYKNGIALGTERSTTSTTPITYSEDLTGFVSGDLVQIYAKNIVAPNGAAISNMKIKSSTALNSFVIL